MDINKERERERHKPIPASQKEKEDEEILENTHIDRTQAANKAEVLVCLFHE